MNKQDTLLTNKNRSMNVATGRPEKFGFLQNVSLLLVPDLNEQCDTLQSKSVLHFPSKTVQSLLHIQKELILSTAFSWDKSLNVINCGAGIFMLIAFTVALRLLSVIWSDKGLGHNGAIMQRSPVQNHQYQPATEGKDKKDTRIIMVCFQRHTLPPFSALNMEQYFPPKHGIFLYVHTS